MKKKVAIMQPYFFPYLGYYSLIENSDEFIIFDVVQYMRHGWIERNRVLKPEVGWQYIAAPLVKVDFGTKIMDVKIKNVEDWRDKIVRQLAHYKKKSPHYQNAIEVVKEAMNIETDNIVEMNKNILEVTSKYIGLSPNMSVFSVMDVKIDDVNHPGEWALNISKAIGADEYINPVGGVEIFDPEQFESSKIKLTFLGNNLLPYSQRRDPFEPGLSIIDAMMFNSPERILEMVKDTFKLDVIERGEK